MDCLEAGTRLIGHIKSVVENGESLIACSVTDHDARVRCRGRFESPQDRVDVIINVLQYGSGEEGAGPHRGRMRQTQLRWLQHVQRRGPGNRREGAHSAELTFLAGAFLLGLASASTVFLTAVFLALAGAFLFGLASASTAFLTAVFLALAGVFLTAFFLDGSPSATSFFLVEGFFLVAFFAGFFSAAPASPSAFAALAFFPVGQSMLAQNCQPPRPLHAQRGRSALRALFAQELEHAELGQRVGPLAFRISGAADEPLSRPGVEYAQVLAAHRAVARRSPCPDCSRSPGRCTGP